MDVFIAVFKFFVEKIYSEAISYNRLYNKKTTVELFDIKCRQFFIVWAIIGLLFGATTFCIARFVVHHSLQSYVWIDISVAIILAIPIHNKLNELGMYEETISEVEKLDSKELRRYRLRAALVGSLRAVSFVFGIFLLCWLLTFI